jgi:hypothetical protein
MDAASWSPDSLYAGYCQHPWSGRAISFLGSTLHAAAILQLDAFILPDALDQLE